jgi:hypothetical protein
MSCADEAPIPEATLLAKEILNLRDGLFPAYRSSRHPSSKRVGCSLHFRRQLSLIHSEA